MSRKRQKLAYVSFPYHIQGKRTEEEFADMIDDIFEAGYTPLINILYLVEMEVPEITRMEIMKRFINACDILVESSIGMAITSSVLQEIRIAKELGKEVVNISLIRKEIQ
jgi:hypothetical protein